MEPLWKKKLEESKEYFRQNELIYSMLKQQRDPDQFNPYGNTKLIEFFCPTEKRWKPIKLNYYDQTYHWIEERIKEKERTGSGRFRYTIQKQEQRYIQEQDQRWREKSDFSKKND